MKNLVRFGVSLPVASILVATSISSAQAAGFTPGDIFSGTGDSFTLTGTTDPTDPALYALFCDPLIVGPSVGIASGGPTSQCAKIDGSSSSFNVSANPANMTGGFAPFLNADLLARAYSFGPANTGPTGTNTGSNLVTVFTTSQAGLDLTIKVDTATLVATGAGPGNPVNFFYTGIAEVTGADTYSAPITFSFTTQNATLVNNTALVNFVPGQDGGIYDTTIGVNTWSVTVLAVESVPEPSTLLGLGLLACGGAAGAIKRRLNK